MGLGRRASLIFRIVSTVVIAAPILIGCGGGGGSNGGGGGGGSTPTLALLVNPPNPTVYAGVTFSVTVSATTFGTSATPTITVGSLPAGLSTTASFPMSVPAGGATITFTTSTSIAAGSYTIAVSGTAASATAAASIPLKVASGTPPQSFFTVPLFREIGLAPGTSTSLQLQLTGDAIYNVSLSIDGLPQAVTASFSPQTLVPGNTFRLTLTAGANVIPAQNIELTLTGTPAANVAPASLKLLLDISSAKNVGWTNQTSYVSTRATPYSAVYDQSHQLIYSSNLTWNRIDVISDKTRSVVTTIPIRDPRGMDLSVDGTRVWIATGSQVMYSIDTTTLKATRYQLPGVNQSSFNPAGSWEGAQVLSLADGTLMLIVSGQTGSGDEIACIWNPTSNALKLVTMPAGLPASWGVFARSGDGKRVFVLGGDELETSATYDVLNKSFSATKQLSDFGYATLVAANTDGSRVAVADLGNGFTLYDGNLNVIGALPGDGGWGSFPPENLLFGGFVFSPDGKTLYEETEATAIPVIIGIDVAIGQVVALAPAMPVVPTFAEMSPPFHIPQPFAVDAAGMILGVQYHGIAFDDSTPQINFSSLEPGSPIFLQHMSLYSGPLAGGTTSGGFGNAFSLLPDVYYGAAKGTATLSSNSLSITSPPASSAGPVDVKILFPDGIEVFSPQFFTYGTQIQDAIISGGAPQGGTPAKLDAFGLPLDPSQDIVTLGGNRATVTSTVAQYPPFTGEQTGMYLSYTTPPGVPGWADLTVTTPNGSGTLPKAFRYAKSVADYAVTDSPSFILFDSKRNQVYLSAGNHIDVFSLSSLTFVTPLNSPVSGSQLQGLTLTPDGSSLLAADLGTGALAVFNPDAPPASYEISLPGSLSSYNQCSVGPLFVVADNQGNALVNSGAVVGQPSCGPQAYPVFAVNLAAKTASTLNASGCGNPPAAAFLSATHDGSLVAFSGGFKIYLPAQKTCIPTAAPAQGYNVIVSGDGNVLGLERAFADNTGNIIGRFAFPGVFYPSVTAAVYYNYSPYQDGALQNPRMNDAGSLYYWAYPNYIDIVDAQHGTPALRFGLTERVSNVVAPMAIDAGGQQIFLITNKGLTIIDLGDAPLSVGHLSEVAAAPGVQIVMRGSGFQNGITVSLGGVHAAAVLTDSTTLSLTVPVVSAGLQDLVVQNPDGASYTLQNALTVQ